MILMDAAALWSFLIVGYCMTVLVETPILVVGLSARHSIWTRLGAGLWLTACTYPVVILVLPSLIDPEQSRAVYLAFAETFAPAAKALLFWAAFNVGRHDRRANWRDAAVIVAANLASFAFGEWLHVQGWY